MTDFPTGLTPTQPQSTPLDIPKVSTEDKMRDINFKLGAGFIIIGLLATAALAAFFLTKKVDFPISDDLKEKLLTTLSFLATVSPAVFGGLTLYSTRGKKKQPAALPNLEPVSEPHTPLPSLDVRPEDEEPMTQAGSLPLDSPQTSVPNLDVRSENEEPIAQVGSLPLDSPQTSAVTVPVPVVDAPPLLNAKQLLVAAKCQQIFHETVTINQEREKIAETVVEWEEKEKKAFEGGVLNIDDKTYHVTKTLQEYSIYKIDLKKRDPHLQHLHLLGEGTTGNVYEIQNLANDVLMAIKVMNPKEKHARSNFLNEFSLLSDLQHPNLQSRQTLLEEGEEALALVMPIAGEELFKLLQKEYNKLSLAELLDWCMDILSALKHLHDKDIWHADLKTENIQIVQQVPKKEAEGKETGPLRRIAKIHDLGGSRKLKSLPNPTFPSMTPIVTPLRLVKLFFSIDQTNFKKYKEFTNQWDLQTTGTLMFNMLTGGPDPFPKVMWGGVNYLNDEGPFDDKKFLETMLLQKGCPYRAIGSISTFLESLCRGKIKTVDKAITQLETIMKDIHLPYRPPIK